MCCGAPWGSPDDDCYASGVTFFIAPHDNYTRLKIFVSQTVNLPARAIGMILSVDWLLNRMRSTDNVLGKRKHCSAIKTRLVIISFFR